MGYVVKAGRAAGQRLDYFKFADYLLGYHSKVNSFVFNSFDESYGISPGLQRFYEDARSKGMTIRLHEMTGDSRDGTHKQRGVDVDMACHMVWQASRAGKAPQMAEKSLESARNEPSERIRCRMTKSEADITLPTLWKQGFADLP
jgi:hypothetical protein